MSGLFSPDEVKGFEELRPIDKAVTLKEYLAQVEAEESRIKSMIQDYCAAAREQNDTDTDGWKLVVKYASGVSSNPDIGMLETEFPERYAQLRESQLVSFKPTLTKADVKWLFSDIPEADRKNIAALIMVEHPVKPQFVLQAKKEGE